SGSGGKAVGPGRKAVPPDRGCARARARVVRPYPALAQHLSRRATVIGILRGHRSPTHGEHSESIDPAHRTVIRAPVRTRRAPLVTTGRENPCAGVRRAGE